MFLTPRAASQTPWTTPQKVPCPGWSFPVPPSCPSWPGCSFQACFSWMSEECKALGCSGRPAPDPFEKGQRADVSGNIFLSCIRMKRKQPRGNASKKIKRSLLTMKSPALLSSFTFPRTLPPSCPQPRGTGASEGARSPRTPHKQEAGAI